MATKFQYTRVSVSSWRNRLLTQIFAAYVSFHPVRPSRQFFPPLVLSLSILQVAQSLLVPKSLSVSGLYNVCRPPLLFVNFHASIQACLCTTVSHHSFSMKLHIFRNSPGSVVYAYSFLPCESL